MAARRPGSTGNIGQIFIDNHSDKSPSYREILSTRRMVDAVQERNMVAPKRVCVIGAGPSGIAAGKNCSWRVCDAVIYTDNLHTFHHGKT
jgi:threonine dehydrogenase-like Zn-dependent dehydrogenase